MPITTRLSEDGTRLTINIEGRFDYGIQNEFRASYESADAAEYVIDMMKTDYIDSSSLAMLLMMREHTGGSKSTITLENCSQDIKTILSVANFQDLFNIS